MLVSSWEPELIGHIFREDKRNEEARCREGPGGRPAYLKTMGCHSTHLFLSLLPYECSLLCNDTIPPFPTRPLPAALSWPETRSGSPSPLVGGKMREMERWFWV